MAVEEGLASSVQVAEADVFLELFALVPELEVEVGVGAARLADDVAARKGGKRVRDGVKIVGDIEVGLPEEGGELRGIDIWGHGHHAPEGRLGSHYISFQPALQALFRDGPGREIMSQ